MEAQIKKMKETFNTEELTNRDEQYNNQNEKHTRGINSRVTEAEEGTSDLEDRMVEITSKEQNIEKINEKKIKTA